MVGERTSNPTPGVGRKRGGRAKPDWSRKAKTQIHAPYNSYAPENMEATCRPGRRRSCGR